MESLIPFISDQILFALGWMIVHAVWQIAGIGLLLWISLQIFRNKSAAFKYRLSISALGVLTILALGTFIYSIPEPNPEASMAMANSSHLDQWILANSNHLIEAPSDWMILSKRIENWIPTLVQFWFLGAMLFLVKLGTSLSDIRNLRQKNHDPADTFWQELLERQIKLLHLAKSVRLLKSIYVDMPMTYGIWKPVILIPTALFLQLPPAQLEAIIAHELAHIKRHDYLVNLFQSFLEVVFFFHPIFWWISKTAKEQRENACDDLAISMGVAPKDLAFGLANVLNYTKNPAPEMAMAATKSKNPTLDRIKRIMGVKYSPTQPTTLTSITMMITLLLGATLLVGASDKKTVESIEDLMTTSLSSKSIEGNWENGFQRSGQDTVPIKKEPNIVSEKTLPDSQSNPESKSIQKNTEENPFMELGMIFKDMDFNWGEFSNIPQLKIDAPLVPPMDFDNMPTLEFDVEMFEHMVPDADFFENIPTAELPTFEADLFNHAFDHNYFRNDTSKMSKEEIRKWKEKHQAEMEKWAEAQKEFHSKMEPKMKEFQEKMKEWEKNNEPKMKEFQMKMEEWQKEFQSTLQPKIEEYQAKIQEWQKANEPKMREFQEKMKVWQEENQPKIEEFQKKMEVWQKENEGKMQEFQQKMQEWQREHQEDMMKIQKSVQETVKKGNN